MRELSRFYEIPKREYQTLIRDLKQRGFKVEVHDRDGRWPDHVFSPDGQVAGYIESPFMIRVDTADVDGPGQELSNFLSLYNARRR